MGTKKLPEHPNLSSEHLTRKDQPYSHPFWVNATKPPEQRMQGYTHPFWIEAKEVSAKMCQDKKEVMEILPSSTQVGGSHYKDLAIQPIHFSERNKLTPMEHTAIKYITRHRFKGTGKQDIEKAIHTLNLILEEYYPNATS